MISCANPCVVILARGLIIVNLRPGFRYSKAEVTLLSLCQPGEFTEDLFATSQPGA